MASLNLAFSWTYTPAFYSLVECAIAIAEQRGEVAAEEWAHRVLNADIDLFCRIELDRSPRLRVIEGGRS